MNQKNIFTRILCFYKRCILTKNQFVHWNNQRQFLLDKDWNIKLASPVHIPFSFVFMSDGTCMNNGIADKLKGLISLYSFCKKNKYKFKIYWNYPFNLCDYLLLNTADRNCQDIYSGAYPILLECHYKRQQISLEEEAKNHISLLNTIIKRGKVKEYHVWTNGCWGNEEFHALFHELFKFHPRIIDSYNSLKPSEDYITLNFRFRQLLGDFQDAAGGEILTNEEQEKLLSDCIYAIHKIRRKQQCSKVLVTTDSKTFMEEIKSIPFVFTVPGEILHTAISHPTYRCSYDKEFLDLYMMAKSIQIFQIHSAKMYYSDFPKVASYIGNIPFEIVEI